jgi:hypothetical protein
MLLFGDEPVYLSHLPMFQAPHNFQALLEVELSADALAAYRADRHVAPADEYYTFEPETFDITELNNGKRAAFNGEIFRGHFEREGRSIVSDVTATVATVVHFAELDVAATADADGSTLRYLCFGRPGRLYLAHEISTRPGFDQVLTARPRPGTVTDSAGRAQPDDVTQLAFPRAVRMEVDSRSDDPAAVPSPGDEIDGHFTQSTSAAGFHGFHVGVDVGRQLYLEVAELG